MSHKTLDQLAEGHGTRAAGAALGGLDGEPRLDRHRERRHPERPAPPRRHQPPRGARSRRRPASPVPGEIAPGVPAGLRRQDVIAGSSTNGIPAAALSAYQRAAQVIDAADTGCNIDWTADRGDRPRRVRPRPLRRQHARPTDGVSKPGIYGIPLDGSQRHHAGSPTPTAASSTTTRSTTARSARCSSSPRPGRSSAWTATATASATRRTSTTRRSRPRSTSAPATRTSSTAAGQRVRGLPLQPQPGVRRTWCCRSWTPTPAATTPRCPTGTAGAARPSPRDYGDSVFGRPAPAATTRAAQGRHQGGRRLDRRLRLRRAAPAPPPAAAARTGSDPVPSRPDLAEATRSPRPPTR